MQFTASSLPDDAAFALLTACGDWPTGERRNAKVRACFAALEGETSDFLRLVDRHHMSMLAAEALRQAGLEPPPQLLCVEEDQKVRALGLTGEAIRVLDRLETAGIDAMLLKGPVLSQALYGDPTMRQSIDLDLLVDWADFRRSISLLQDSGYVLHGSEPPWNDWRIEPWRRMAKDVTLVNPAKRIALELHHRLKSPAELLPGLGIEQATQRISFFGKSLAAFPPEYLFAYLCAHAATSMWDRLKWLADLRALLSERSLEEIEAMQDHARSLGIERCTALGLLLCHRIWDQQLPQTVQAAAINDPYLARLVEASWQRLRGPERHHSSIANSLQRRHLIQLRDDAAYRRSQSAEFLYDREILERFKLPRALRGLYFFLRIGVFIRRKLSLMRQPDSVQSPVQSSMRQNRPA